MKKKCDYVINRFKNTDQLNYREILKTSDLTKCKTTQKLAIKYHFQKPVLYIRTWEDIWFRFYFLLNNECYCDLYQFESIFIHSKIVHLLILRSWKGLLRFLFWRIEQSFRFMRTGEINVLAIVLLVSVVIA